MKLQEQLFCALTDVGDDLVEEAGRLSFPVSPLRRMLPLAACCALLLGAALALESWKPIQEADITLPNCEDTVQEVIPPVEEDAEERPSSAPSSATWPRTCVRTWSSKRRAASATWWCASARRRTGRPPCAGSRSRWPAA